MSEECVYCGGTATEWQITDEFGMEYLCAECDRDDDEPDLSPYL